MTAIMSATSARPAPCLRTAAVRTSAVLAPAVPCSFRSARRAGPAPALRRRAIAVTRAAVDDEDKGVSELESKLGVGNKPQVNPSNTMLPGQKPLPERKSKPYDQMSPAEKAWELYSGEKGALYWINEIAYKSVYVLGALWILFRFVGPALGLYELVNPFIVPDVVGSPEIPDF